MGEVDELVEAFAAELPVDAFGPSKHGWRYWAVEVLAALDRLGFSVVPLPAERIESREWVVISDDGQGTAYAIGVNEFDALARASHWADRIADHHLELRVWERWSTVARLVSSERVEVE